MSSFRFLCERLSDTSVDELLDAGFLFKRYLDYIRCCLCGFETRGTLSFEHIQFMHKLLNSDCEMVRHISCNFNTYRNAKKCISETEKIMISTFRNWPKRQPDVESLVSAGFYYTGKNDEVSCIECKTVLRDWKSTDDPWTEHEKASPDCLLVKIHKRTD